MATHKIIRVVSARGLDPRWEIWRKMPEENSDQYYYCYEESKSTWQEAMDLVSYRCWVEKAANGEA